MFSNKTTASNLPGRMILLYGLPGVGKTSIGHAAPLERYKSLFIELEPSGFETGTHLRFEKQEFGKRMKEKSIPKIINEIGDEMVKAGLNLAVVDTVGKFEDMATAYLCWANGWASIEEANKDYGKGSAAVKAEMALIVKAIGGIAAKGIDVLILAHTQSEDLTAHDGTSRIVLSPQIGQMKVDKAPYRNLLIGDCYAVGNVHSCVSESSKTGQQVETGLVVDFGSSPGSITKIRSWTLPKTINIKNNPKAFWDALDSESKAS